jgi:peptidoglycan/LPS O-acetylase OafA/YrhL
VPLLVFIGQDSLFFYLWHPLAFALWAAWGASGLLLLALSLSTVLLSWVVVARVPALGAVLGVGRTRPSGPVPVKALDLATPGSVV